MIFIGIDPGKAGGIAAVFGDSTVYFAEKMPQTERELFDVFHRAQFTIQGQYRAVLELVRATPQMGVVSAFTFGKGYGAIRMALAAAGIPFDEVTPPVWQRVMQCRTGGDKNISKRRAQELFPALTMTHAIADALLLAEYARRMEQTRGHQETLSQGHQRSTRQILAQLETGAQTQAVKRRGRASTVGAPSTQPATAAAARAGGRAHRSAR